MKLRGVFFVTFMVMSISIASAFISWNQIEDFFSRGSATGYVSHEACSDSDGGANESVLGKTTGPDSYGGNASEVKSYDDICQDEKTLLEFSCGDADGAIIGKNISCNEKCTSGICTLAVNTSIGERNEENVTGDSNISIFSEEDFPDPLSEESKDFFEEFIVEDFLTPESVANAQPDLPSMIEDNETISSLNESIKIDEEEEEFNPPVNKLLLNLSVNTTASPPRLIGRSTYVDKSLLFPQFLPNVRPDAGLYANCDTTYENISNLDLRSLPRGSSTLLYVSALSPSLKCPRAENLDIEISYRLVNTGLAEVYPDGRVHSCKAPWHSPSLKTTGISIVRTPFSVQRIIVPVGSPNKVVSGTFVVPVRSGRAINFNHFQYTSPRVVYLEAFRGKEGDYTSMEFTLVRCVEGKGVKYEMDKEDSSDISEEILEPTFFARFKCKISSFFGNDYDTCLYQ